jgi:ferric-dicitrate binding protein FerR (iron transport regulator)
MNILATPRGGEFKVTLEDGTVVWLNAASQLCYPDSFSGNERRVRLIGEAYFHVAKNEKKPFFVETANQIVRVYGTEFDINSYNENKVVYTTLVTGKVSLYPANGSQTELVLTPGHQAQFSKSDASTSVRSVDTDVMTSWIHGMFVFEDQTLEQIMQALGRWYNFTFEFRSKTAASTIFMGSMSRYSDFDDVLKILEQSGDLKFVVNGRHVVIFTKQ